MGLGASGEWWEKSDEVSFTFFQCKMSINQNNCVLFLFYGPRFMCRKGRDFKRNEGYVHEKDWKSHDAICYGRCLKCKQNLVLKHLLTMHIYICDFFYRCDPWGLYFTSLSSNQQSFSSFLPVLRRKSWLLSAFFFKAGSSFSDVMSVCVMINAYGKLCGVFFS